MIIQNSKVKRILFITLSNIGDVILTLPVLDSLREGFPQSKITVMVGPRPAEIFQGNSNINRIIIYDKHSRLKEKINLFNGLRKEKFDMVVDLRNTFFGAFLPAKYRTSPFRGISKNITHMKNKHLYRAGINEPLEKKSLYISPKDEEYINNILRMQDITDKDKIIVVSSGARSHIKRWSKNKFVELVSNLIKEFGAKVILVGDQNDIPINKYINEHLKYPVLDLSAKTTIAQLAALLKRVKFLITNDSAVLHLASYLDIPIVAIFGPTNEAKYGPWSDRSVVVKKDIFCRPCEKSRCRFGTLECMQLVRVEDVFRQTRDILVTTSLPLLSSG